MEQLTPLIWGAVALLVLFATALVVLVNVHGRRLGKHDDWIRAIDARVEGMRKPHDHGHVRSLNLTTRIESRVPRGTIQVTDDMLITDEPPPRKEQPQ